MPYISAEEVKEKRNLIKKAFPVNEGWKFSIRNRDHSTICVTIKEAPFNMLEEGFKYEKVNHFYIKEHYQDRPRTQEVLLKLYDIINANNGVLVEDGDYGIVPNFYTDITIGSWDSPFVVSTDRLASMKTKEIIMNFAQCVGHESKLKEALEILNVNTFYAQFAYDKKAFFKKHEDIRTTIRFCMDYGLAYKTPYTTLVIEDDNIIHGYRKYFIDTPLINLKGREVLKELSK